MRDYVLMEDGKRKELTDDTEIHCEIHEIKFLWGDLNGIQKSAMLAGIDTESTLPCLFAKEA
jgi:hypothetical protein